MTLADDRRKWNLRYGESNANTAPAPHPLTVRWRHRMVGGRMLDAACGLGRGIAGAAHLFHQVHAIDISDVGIERARAIWNLPNVEWTVGDVTQHQWPVDHFGLVCAFGFTDLAFFDRMRSAVLPGGMFLYEGFSRRQLQLKPDLDPAWTVGPGDLERLFPYWEVLELGELDDAPYRVRYAAVRLLSA